MIKNGYRIDEAAEYLGISTKQVYRLIENGKLLPFKIGKRGIRIARPELEKFISDQMIKYSYDNGIN